MSKPTKTPFLYKTSKPASPHFPKTMIEHTADPEEEPLTGFVMGFPASDLEERTARALDKYGVSYDFRLQVMPGVSPYFLRGRERNTTGAVEVDFVVYQNGIMYPIQIDGEFSHKSAEQVENDRRKDGQLNDALRGTGAALVVRIPYYELKDQAMTDSRISEILL